MGMGASSMRLNRADGRCLGVCAGIADWLDIPATLVRIVFIICVICWPPLILGYFLLYFCLDKELTPERMQDYFKNAKTAEHFRRLNYRKPIYKNQRNKRIAGVCSGIADYLEVSAFSVRAVTLASLFVFGPFTFWAYVICIFIFDNDPYATGSDRAERRRQRWQRRSQRWQERAERLARRHARREAKRQGRRKSYVNEEFQADVDEFESDIEDTVSRVKDEIGEAVNKVKQATSKSEESRNAKYSNARFSRAECTEIYSSLEMRLREIEAFMTSKKFRLHCEINRI